MTEHEPPAAIVANLVSADDRASHVFAAPRPTPLDQKTLQAARTVVVLAQTQEALQSLNRHKQSKGYTFQINYRPGNPPGSQASATQGDQVKTQSLDPPGRAPLNKAAPELSGHREPAPL